MQNLNSDDLRRQLDENNESMNTLADDNQRIVELLAQRGLKAMRREFDRSSTAAVHEETINAVVSLAKDAAAAHLNSEFNSCLSKIRKLLTAEQQPIIPNEHGKNRYGLDMSYFRNLFNRELNRPLVDFKPSELARVLAHASRTADPKVMHETEFQIAEQKPAPDVSALVEALEIFVANPTPTSEDFDRANAVLAAHRKGDQP